ncbi:hypothetical protein ACIBCT_04090 [Streptosporangium sp. NPDC050855]|uniref:hypothetical protein n=1 Tax=Streptosporangium sp. NPDC050855 TaxID=3366194 RepID=UPI0037B0864C
MRAVIALALLPVLVLPAACAPPEPPPFVPADLSSGTGASVSASPSGPPTGEAAEPRTETVRVAPGVRVVVEWPVAPDPDRSAMIEVFRDYVAGAFRAVTSEGRDTGYLGLVEHDAADDASAWAQAFLDRRRSVRGVARLYMPNVSAVSGSGDRRGAQLDVCVDETRMRLLDASTGEPVPRQPDWTRRPFLQSAAMGRTEDGSWRIRLFRHAKLPDERAKGCLR